MIAALVWAVSVFEGAQMARFWFALLIVATLGCREDVISKSRNQLTLAKYTAIETGMSYGDVVDIIGFGGTELSRSKLGGVTTVMYQWQRTDGSNMNAMFQNDRLVQKAQFGLR